MDHGFQDWFEAESNEVEGQDSFSLGAIAEKVLEEIRVGVSVNKRKAEVWYQTDEKDGQETYVHKVHILMQAKQGLEVSEAEKDQKLNVFYQKELYEINLKWIES